MKMTIMKACPAGRRDSGFTLIELLVVVAIIAVLAAIMFPVFARVRENARRASCSSNLKQIGLAVLQYTQDYDEKMPPSMNKAVDSSDTPWHTLMLPYTRTVSVFRCPSNTSSKTSLVYGSDTSDTPGGVRRSYIANGGIETAGGTAPKRGTGGLRPWQDQRNITVAVTIPIVSLTNPTTTISATETKGINLSDATAQWMSCFMDPSRTFTNHLGTANFLFVDGHVKAMQPTATATPEINMWTINNNTTLPSVAVGAPATLQTTMAKAEIAMPISSPALGCDAY